MFENPSALILLSILIPVIILYILKPKPMTIKMPSLLLLISDSQKKRLKSLFETLLRDPLLLIQLIAITLLVIALANPYYFGSARYDSTVIVLDSSASMAAADVVPDRFTQAVDIAQEYIVNSGKVSLVLAGNTPVLLVKDADSRKALDAIKRQRPKATGTNLNDAILLALDLIGSQKGKLVVISDFSGEDITLTRKIIDSRNIRVEYRQVGTGGSNAGIVWAAIEGSNLKFSVKNYNSAARDVRLNIINGDSVRSINRTIKQKSTDFFSVSNLSGLTKVMLLPEDDLLIDNTLYVSMPGLTHQRVLLISDHADRKSPLYIAFSSIPGLEVQAVSFNSAPRKPDYSMVVLYGYSLNSLLPGTMNDLRNFVEGGGTLVIEAADDLQFMELGMLLPVNVSGLAKPSRFDVRSTELTNNIDFGISGYLKSEIKEGAVELASGEEGPVLAYWNMGKGKVAYLGMNERWGDFHLQGSYPVFWFKLLNFAVQNEELNYKTGTVLPLGTTKYVQGPGFSSETNNLYLDETGFYNIEDKTIAANLLDWKESDISVPKIEFIEPEKVSGSNVEKIYLTIIFSILAILLVAIELYYLKYRGNI